MKKDKKIAYFAGCTANYVDPDVGRSTIRVLKRLGFQLLLLDEKCCGIPQLAVGNLREFLKHAEFNVRSLAGADCDIVTACTSCALAIKRDYPRYQKNNEAEEVSRRTYDIMEYLAMLKASNTLNTDFKPVDLYLVYHAPCHLKVLGEELIDRRLELMRLIPGLSVDRIERGCCGMGGTFGSKRKNYAKSMEIGQALFEGIAESAPDLVITECPGCELQIRQGTGLEVTHPVHIIKQACGL
jgi:glycerol-3-phosphate dehydrogenase subunit C